MNWSASFWEGDLVRLRAIEAADWEYYSTFDRHSGDVRGVSAIGLPKSAETYQRETRELADRKTTDDCFALGIEAVTENVLVGALATFNADHRAGCFGYGIAVQQRYQRRHFATAAATILLSYMFGERRYHKCVAEIYAFNVASLALHRRLGFREEGRLREQTFLDGSYHDVIMMGLLAEVFGPGRPNCRAPSR
jgi:RimJ/RimL family protein N-acetyltransferase